MEDPKVGPEKVAKFLYNNIPIREAIVNGQRCTYFRGKKLYDLLLNDTEKHSDKPECSSKADASEIGYRLLKAGFIHASRVRNKERRELELVTTTKFDEDGYYIWQWEPRSRTRTLLLALFIIAVLGFTMYPIWPMSVKVGIWYISVTLLIIMVGFTFIRLILYIFFWMVGYEFWIFPNLFDDDLGVVDSFKPFISFERCEDFKESLVYRLALIGVVVAFGYWVYTQPTELDEILVIQRKFVQDLYEGNLLSDESEKNKENIDKIIPNLEELERELEDEDEIEKNMEKMMEEDDQMAQSDESSEEAPKQDFRRLVQARY